MVANLYGKVKPEEDVKEPSTLNLVMTLGIYTIIRRTAKHASAFIELVR